jgi:LPS export ABC transporter protein LptC
MKRGHSLHFDRLHYTPMRKFYRALSVISFGLVFLISSCVNDLTEVNEAAARATPSIETGKDIEIIYSEKGKVNIKLEAPTVTRYNTEEPYIEFTEGLKVYFYNDSMQVKSRLRANYGVRYDKSGETIVRNDVLVYNEQNEKLETEELTWDFDTESIRSDKFVKITTADEVLFGQGFEADENFSKYKILKPEGTIKVDFNETNEDF